MICPPLLPACLPQAEYAGEGLAWTHVDFADNQPCLDLIDSRPQQGLLHLLDQQCAMPNGTDATFALELRQRFEQHASFAALQLFTLKESLGEAAPTALLLPWRGGPHSIAIADDDQRMTTSA